MFGTLYWSVDSVPCLQLIADRPEFTLYSLHPTQSEKKNTAIS